MEKSINKRNWLLSLTLVLLLSISLTGCGEKETAESLLRDMQKNLQKAESFKGDMNLDIKMQVEEFGVSMAMNAGMDSEMQMVKEQKVAHINGNFNVDMMDFKVAIEVYTKEHDGGTDVYVKVGNQWMKMTSAITETGNETQSGQEPLDIKEFFKDMPKLEPKTETLNDQEVYVLKGSMDGEKLGKQMKSQKDQLDEEAKELLNKVDFSQTDIPMTIRIYKKSLLPAAMEIDMAGLVTAIYQTIGAEEDVSIKMEECVFNITYEEYGNVEKIEIPQEALDASNLWDSAEEGFGIY